MVVVDSTVVVIDINQCEIYDVMVVDSKVVVIDSKINYFYCEIN